MDHRAYGRWGSFLLVAIALTASGFGCGRREEASPPMVQEPRAAPARPHARQSETIETEKALGVEATSPGEPDMAFVPTNPEEEAMMQARARAQMPRFSAPPASAPPLPSLPMPTTVGLPELFGPARTQVGALLGIGGTAEIDGDENSGTIRMRSPLVEAVFDYQRDDLLDLSDLDLLPCPDAKRYSALEYSLTTVMPEQIRAELEAQGEAPPNEGILAGPIEANSVIYTTSDTLEQVRQFYLDRYREELVEPPRPPFAPATAEFAQMVVVGDTGRLRAITVLPAKNAGVTQIVYTEYTGLPEETYQRLGATPEEIKERLRRRSLGALVIGLPEGPALPSTSSGREPVERSEAEGPPSPPAAQMTPGGAGL